jgi:3-deoxy-7-phosphoheptulonate synthase
MPLEDKVNVINTRAGGFEIAPTPRQIIEAQPLNGMEKTIYEGRRIIESILDGRDKRFMMIVGPCSIHDTQQAIEYTKKLKIVADEVKEKIQLVMRVYVEKPRSEGGWPGMLYDPLLDDSDNIPLGIKQVRNLFHSIVSLDILTATELVDPMTTQYYSDLLVYAAIGARTTESQPHRFMASGLSMPVGFKNSTSGDINAAVSAAITARQSHKFLGVDFDGRMAVIGPTKGNIYSHVILRGGKKSANYNEGSVDEALNLLKKKGINLGLIIDASHDNSKKTPEKQPDIVYEVIRQRKIGKNIVGVMIESNINPGSQKMPYPIPKQFSLLHGVSITDPCLSWEDTKNMIYKAYELL